MIQARCAICIFVARIAEGSLPLKHAKRGHLSTLNKHWLHCCSDRHADSAGHGVFHADFFTDTSAKFATCKNYPSRDVCMLRIFAHCIALTFVFTNCACWKQFARFGAVVVGIAAGAVSVVSLTCAFILCSEERSFLDIHSMLTLLLVACFSTGFTAKQKRSSFQKSDRGP